MALFTAVVLVMWTLGFFRPGSTTPQMSLSLTPEGQHQARLLTTTAEFGNVHLHVRVSHPHNYTVPPLCSLTSINETTYELQLAETSIDATASRFAFELPRDINEANSAHAVLCLADDGPHHPVHAAATLTIASDTCARAADVTDSGVPCGSGDCTRCPAQSSCSSPCECASGVCNSDNTCTATPVAEPRGASTVIVQQGKRHELKAWLPYAGTGSYARVVARVYVAASAGYDAAQLVTHSPLTDCSIVSGRWQCELAVDTARAAWITTAVPVDFVVLIQVGCGGDIPVYFRLVIDPCNGAATGDCLACKTGYRECSDIDTPDSVGCWPSPCEHYCASTSDCPAGMLCDVGAHACEACPDGYFADGVACVRCTSCTGGGLAIATACTTASDAVCTCAAGYFDDGGSGTDAPRCTPCTACTGDQYQAVACQEGGSSLVDAVCDSCAAACDGCDGPTASDCVTCAEGFYMLEGTCVRCSTCAPGSFMQAQCTATRDTTCAPCHESCGECHGNGDAACDVCAPGYAEDDGGVCRACSAECGVDSYITAECPSAAGEGSSLFQCATCRNCTAQLREWVQTCEGGNDAICGECNAGYYEDNEGTCRQCDASCVGCSGASAWACDLCAEGYFRDASGRCTRCGPACPSGSFEAHECVANGDNARDRECATCTSCGELNREPLRACSSTSDTECGLCKPSFYLDSNSTCARCSACNFNTYRVASCSATHDIVCGECDAACVGCSGPGPESCDQCAHEFFWDGSTSGQCSACSPACGPGEFEASPCISNGGGAADRQCLQCTDCAALHRSEQQPCSEAVDATCGECRPGYYEADGLCFECSTCPEDSFESSACSDTSDAVCQACDHACAGCQGAGSGACVACAEGYHRASSGNCER